MRLSAPEREESRRENREAFKKQFGFTDAQADAWLARAMAEIFPPEGRDGMLSYAGKIFTAEMDPERMLELLEEHNEKFETKLSGSDLRRMVESAFKTWKLVRRGKSPRAPGRVVFDEIWIDDPDDFVGFAVSNLGRLKCVLLGKGRRFGRIVKLRTVQQRKRSHGKDVEGETYDRKYYDIKVNGRRRTPSFEEVGLRWERLSRRATK